MASYRTVRLDDDAVRVTVEGDFSFEAARRLILDAAADAATAGQDLLVDLRPIRAGHSFREVRELAGTFAAHRDSFRGRVALLDDFDERFEKTQFFEFVVTERGFEVRSFLDEGEAVAWLERPGR